MDSGFVDGIIDCVFFFWRKGGSVCFAQHNYFHILNGVLFQDPIRPATSQGYTGPKGKPTHLRPVTVQVHSVLALSLSHRCVRLQGKTTPGTQVSFESRKVYLTSCEDRKGILALSLLSEVPAPQEQPVRACA